MGARSRQRRKRGPEPPERVRRPRIWLILSAVAIAVVGWFAIQPRIDSDQESPIPADTFDPQPLFDEPPVSQTEDEMASEAMTVLAELETALPNSADAQSVKGHILSLFGRSQEAMECWQRALELDPRYAPAHRQIGDQLLQDGQYEEAVRHLRQAMELDNSVVGAPNQLARALMHAGQMEESLAVLQRGLDDGTAAEGAHSLLGQVSLLLNRFEEAKKYLQRAIAESPEDTKAYIGLARAAARLGDRSEAVRWQEKYRELKAADDARGVEQMRSRDDVSRVRQYLAVTYREAGNVYLTNQELKLAERHWLAAAARAPNDVNSRSMLEQLYRESNQLSKRVHVLRQLAALEPVSPGYVLELGHAWFAVGRVASAEEAFQEYCRLVPADAAGYSALALLRVQSNRGDDQAVQLAEKAVALNETASTQFILGVARQSTGDQPGALAALQRATELDPQNPTYRAAYDGVRDSR